MSKVKGVATQLQSILDEFAERIDAETDEVMEDVVKDTAEDLRRTSPRRKPVGGDYAESWTWKKEKHRFIVHNKDHYRLTHLLEKGHVIRNKYGTYDRTNGNPHIRRAENRAIEQLFRELNKLV